MFESKTLKEKHLGLNLGLSLKSKVFRNGAEPTILLLTSYSKKTSFPHNTHLPIKIMSKRQRIFGAFLQQLIIVLRPDFLQ